MCSRSGRVIEVLGAIDDPGMEIEIAVRKFAVPHEFPAAALRTGGGVARHRVAAATCAAVSICAMCRW